MWYAEFGIAAAAQLLAGYNAQKALRRMRHVPLPQGLPGRGQPLLDAAFLSGGPARVVDTVIVRMQREGRLIVSRSGRVTITNRNAQDAVEATLIAAAGSSGRTELSTLRRELARSEHVQRIGDGLAARGLMRRPDLHRKARTARRLFWFVQLLVIGLGVLAAVGWLGLSAAEQGARTAPFFPFLGLLLVGLFWLAVSKPERARITPAGVRQLDLIRTGSPWQPHEAAMAGGAVLLGAVALEGVGALDDSQLRDAMEAEELAARARAASSGSTSSSDSGASTWCSSSDPGSSSSCGSSSSSCGSSSSSCGSSSGSSCGSSSGSSCGSSCGGGGCGGS
ncbi:TIGR04222 domain-containing membrane protein [Kitasatospora sp. NPDC096147]|uniref:TIGR04222 domain-containing membrane protein n=1 Tax=Kitasatospora sp. NPDC096147 TaxID=3364093 RepID=UPI0038010E5E